MQRNITPGPLANAQVNIREREKETRERQRARGGVGKGPTLMLHTLCRGCDQMRGLGKMGGTWSHLSPDRTRNRVITAEN